MHSCNIEVDSNPYAVFWHGNGPQFFSTERVKKEVEISIRKQSWEIITERNIQYCNLFDTLRDIPTEKLGSFVYKVNVHERPTGMTVHGITCTFLEVLHARHKDVSMRPQQLGIDKAICAMKTQDYIVHIETHKAVDDIMPVTVRVENVPCKNDAGKRQKCIVDLSD